MVELWSINHTNKVMQVPNLDGTVSRRLFWGILALALLLRVLYLPSMPLHHDESLHAFYSHQIERALFHDGNYEYRYDPTYHGPVLYYLNALVYAVLGTNDFTSRLVPILLGVLLLVLVYDLRRYIGDTAALVAMGLFAISPTFVYFSRFLRMDIYSTFFNIAMVVCIMRYITSRKPLWIVLFAASLSLSFCTKENIYLTIFIFGSYACLWGILRSVLDSEFLPSFRRKLKGKNLSGAVLGAILGAVLFFWMVKQLIPIVGGTYEGMAGLFSSAAVSLVAKLAAALFGVVLGFVAGGMLGIYKLIASISVFCIIWITFFTALYQQPGDINAFARAWGYWITQHKSERVGGPWNYYLPFAYLYELLVFVPIAIAIFLNRRKLRAPPVLFLCLFAMVIIRWNVQGAGKLGALTLRWFLLFFPIFAMLMAGAFLALWLSIKNRIKPFTGFLAYWAVWSIFLYSFAGEKVPWLLTHILEPYILLSAIAIAGFISRGRRCVVAIICVLALFTLYLTANLNYRFSSPDPGESPGEAEKGRHAELMVYVQSTTDVKRMLRHIDDLSRRTGAGKKLNMVVSGTANWPMSWYLRDYPVNYSAKVTRGVNAPVVITDWDDYPKHSAWMSESYDPVRYQLRGWWIPDTSRVPVLEPLQSIFGLGDRGKAWSRLGQSLRKLLAYFFTRSVFSPMGSSDVVFWVNKDVAAGLPLERVLPAPKGPPSLAYEGASRRIKPISVWGEAGSGPGQFKEPRGIAVDREGYIYVADTLNNRVQKFTAEGRFVASWGSAGNGPGEFNQLQGIAVDRGGNVYVADTWNNRVQKFSSDGTFLLQWGRGIGSQPGEFYGPRGIAVDDAGDVYVADTGNKRVQKFSGRGKLILSWGEEGSAEGELIEPVGIVCSGKEVWVADTGNRRVQAFSRKGVFKRSFRVAGWEEFYTEPYICIGEEGVLAATDSRNNCVALYAAGGELQGRFGSGGDGPGRFNWPMGIAYDGKKLVYVVDCKNGRVQSFPARKVFGK